jgi:hypothetical protein
MPQEPLSEGKWDNALLQPVAEINEQLLEILRARAQSALAAMPGFEMPALPRLLSAQEALWRELDSPAQRRLAQCPYLLLDGGFGVGERWEHSPQRASGVMDAGATGRYFSSRSGIALLRRTFVLAWHLARSNRFAARILLGMSPACAERIAACPLMQLEALAETSPAWVVPRWELQPNVWRQLIRAALDDRAPTLRAVQLRGLQLLAGVIC